MTSIPALRSFWMITFAPTSWPSKPGLAIKTLMGLLSVIPDSFFLFYIQDLPLPPRDRAGVRGKEMDEFEILRKRHSHPCWRLRSLFLVIANDRRERGNPIDFKFL